MKTIRNLLLTATMFFGLFYAAHAQKKNARLEVTTRLKETNGNYEQRKIYRTFLISAMKECPYISHFNITEVKEAIDNHAVIWHYQVNGWDDITSFYNWIDDKLNHSKDATLIAALTPYKPDYAIGGKIVVKERQKGEVAVK